MPGGYNPRFRLHRFIANILLILAGVVVVWLST